MSRRPTGRASVCYTRVVVGAKWRLKTTTLSRTMPVVDASGDV